MSQEPPLRLIKLGSCAAQPSTHRGDDVYGRMCCRGPPDPRRPPTRQNAAISFAPPAPASSARSPAGAWPPQGRSRRRGCALSVDAITSAGVAFVEHPHQPRLQTGKPASVTVCVSLKRASRSRPICRIEQLAALQLRRNQCSRARNEVHMPAQHVIHGGTAAAIATVRDLDAARLPSTVMARWPSVPTPTERTAPRPPPCGRPRSRRQYLQALSALTAMT